MVGLFLIRIFLRFTDKEFLLLNPTVFFVVPTDSKGVIIDTLEQLIDERQDRFRKTDEKHPYRALFYTVPVFNNPKSVSLSPGLSYCTQTYVIKLHDEFHRNRENFT